MSKEVTTRPRRIRWWHALGVAAGSLAVLAALAAMLGWFAVGSARGRRHILARVTAAAAARGIDFTAKDFALSLRRGCIELREFRIGTPGAAPLLEAENVVACPELATLTQPLVHVRELRLERWTLSPDAWVGFPTDGTSAPGSPRRFAVDRIALVNGAVARTALPAPAVGWAVAAARIDLEGSLRDDRLRLHARAAEVRVERPAVPAWSGQLEVTLDASLDGSVEVERLALGGAGLDLQATLRGAWRPQPRLEGTLTADVEPAGLVPELASGGRLRFELSGRYPELQGTCSLAGEDLKLDDLARFVPAGLLERASATGTSADVRAAASVGPAGLLHPTGTATVRWRRGKEVLANGELRLDSAPGSPDGATRLGFQIALLPGLEGERTVSGELRAPDLAALSMGRLAPATAFVRAPDVKALHRELARAFPSLVPPLPAEVPASGSLEATVVVSGRLDDLQGEARATWMPAAGGKIELEAAGWQARLAGRARVTLGELPLAIFHPGWTGTLGGVIEAEGSGASYLATASLAGTDLALGPDYPRVDRLRVEASTDGRTATLRLLEAGLGERQVRATGSATLQAPIEAATLHLELERPAAGIALVTANLVLAEGVLRGELPFVDSAAGALAARIELPLGALARVPGLAGALASLPLRAAEGPIHLQLWAPRLDSCGALAALGLPDRPEHARGGVSADLWVDPGDLAGVFAELQLDGVRLSTGSDDVTVESPVRLAAGNRRVLLEPVVFRALGTRFEGGGEAVLAADWRPERDNPLALVRSLELRAEGRVPMALLAPYLGGGVGRGEFVVKARASGPLEDLRAVARIESPGAFLYWPTPYATRVTEPAADLYFGSGELVIANGRLALNGGDVAFSGKRYADGFVSLRASLARLAYGLDFGVKARIGGELDFAWDPASRGLLSGTVVLERGVLDRDLDLEREVLPRFLAPVQTPGSSGSLLDTIDLDLRVETVEGLRVRNNVANLRAFWEPLEVGGTLWSPTIQGQVEIDPGGCVSAYNQRFRLDRAVATFTGDPVNDPRLDVSLTSSLEDDTICREPGDPLAWGRDAAPGGGSMEGLATGLAGYFGERLVGGVGERLGLGRITIRPVYVFGETDPSARLTLTRDISRHAALAVSLDLRNTQRQTYILDLHGFRKLPRFVVQAFSNDEGNPGGSLQQVLELGGSKTSRGSGPELERVVVDAPTKRLAKLVRRALRAGPGKPLPDDALLDAEIEAGQALREAGYPEATVAASVRPSARRGEQVELVVKVEPGRRVRVTFTGDRPPAVTRRSIASAYRLDEYEPTSRLEMHDATVRALRSLGFLDPRVSVTASPGDPIQVTVHSVGGERVELGSVVFSGLPPDEAAILASRFAGPTERTELAAGTTEAYRRVEQTLRALGYSHGQLRSRRIDAASKALVVDLEAGPQDHVARVEIVGVPEADAARLLPLLPVRAGDAARLDRFGEAAVLVERDLAARGFADARVRALPVRTGEGTTTLRIEVQTGEARRVAALRFSGQRTARESWLRSVVRLEEGEPLDPQRLAEARARLLGSGRFLGVATAIERAEAGADVTFRLQEAPRFSIAYGVRWESEAGLSALVDVADRSVLGRGLEAAVRARWEPNDRSGRLLFRLPSIREGRFSLEAFGERRRRLDGGFVTDSGTGTLQLSRMLAAALTARVYARYSDVHIYEQEPDPFFPFDVRIRHPYIGLQVIRDTREHPVLGVRGMLASLDLSGSGPWLGSDYRYARAYAQLNLFRPLGTLGGWPIAWASSLRAGAARAFGGQELLTDVRFKTGGEYSVRGYPFESLGPRVDLGGKPLATGGAAVLVVNQEVRLALPWFDLMGLAFFDAGQVWAERADFGRDLAKSVGVGVRASTPVGVVRLDLARPLDRRPGDPSFKAYFGLGSTF